MWRTPRALYVLALTLGSAGPAAAQDLNYNTYLIGTRALGMGGAFTGVADDPSAAYHNPAGLGLIVRSSTSANLSVIAVEGWVIEGGYGSVLGPRNLEHDAIPSLPLFVGFVQKFGDHGDDGVRQHGIALNIVRPGQVRRSFRVDVLDADLGLADSIRIDEESSSEWYGVSYGVRITPGLAIGIGGWVALRSFEHSEERFVARGVIPVGASRTADRLLTRQTFATLDSIDLVFRLGVLWQIDPAWRVGLMLQPGPINISSNATISDRAARTGMGAPPVIDELSFVEEDGLSGDAPLPWQLRLGASYAFAPTFLLAMDVAVYAPIGGPNGPVQTFGPPVPDPVTGEVPSPGQFVAREWYANITANVALGFDALIEDVVPLEGGVFTDFSAAPPIEGPSPVYRPPQVHGIGASLAGGFRRGDFDVMVGVAGVLGWGTGLGSNPNPEAPAFEAYLPRSVRTHTIYVFINGTERAAASLVEQILGDLNGGGASGDARDATEEEEEEQAAEIDEAEREAARQDEEPPAPARTAPAEDARQAAVAPRYLRSPWADLATER